MFLAAALALSSAAAHADESMWTLYNLPPKLVNAKDSVKTSRHNYEIDFLLASRNKICPIEVKSSGYKTHKSLDEFCKKYSDRILDKYLVYTKDLAKDSDILCLPVYMVPFL